MSHFCGNIKRYKISIPIDYDRTYQGYHFSIFGNFENLKTTVEKTEYQDEIMFFISLKNNRVTSQNFYKLSNFITFYAGEIRKIKDFPWQNLQIG